MRWRPLLLPVLAVLVVHGAALKNGFVYDDGRFITGNPAVVRGVPLPNYFTDPSTFSADEVTTGAWRPLRTILWRVVVKLAGETPEPWAFRLLNILLHGLAAALLVRLLQGVGMAAWPSSLAATLFAVHPMTVEAVDWVSSLAEPLTAVLLLSFLLARPKITGLWKRPVFLVAGAFVVLLAKESAAGLPVLLAAHGLARRERFSAVLRDAGWASLGVLLYIVARWRVLGEGFGQEERDAAGALFEMGRGWLEYLRTFALLRQPVFDEYWPTPSPAHLAAVGWGLMAVLAVWGARGVWRARRESAPGPAALGALAVVGAFLPVMQWIPLNIIVADRFAYLALMPASALVVGGLFRWAPRRAAAWTAGAILLVSAGRALVAERAWRDDEQLWKAVLDRREEMSISGRPSWYLRARFNWGRAVFDRFSSAEAARDSKEFDEAFAALREGYQVAPGGAVRLARAALRMHRPVVAFSAAAESISRALGGDAVARRNLDAAFTIMEAALIQDVMNAPPDQKRVRARAALAALENPEFALARRLGTAGPFLRRRLVQFLKMRKTLLEILGRGKDA